MHTRISNTAGNRSWKKKLLKIIICQITFENVMPMGLHCASFVIDRPFVVSENIDKKHHFLKDAIKSTNHFLNQNLVPNLVPVLP